jgi:hypothetical protein
MENRHKDALLRIAQADAMWSKDGHEPVVFHLIPRGGMQRHVDHPRWDESWSIPGEATIDDLQEMGFLRVEPVGLNQNGRTFSLTLKGREAAAALATPIIVSSNDAPGPEGMDARPSEDEVDAASPRRTAFISWAHGDRTWEKTIARFASQLRAFGVNADVDLFHLNDDDVIWANYGGQAIQANEFVLIAVSGPYKERWEGTNDGRVGAGAAREANVMKGLFDDDQHDFFRKGKIVVLPGSTVADIPAELRASAQRFEIHTLDLDGLEELLRTLTGQAAYVPPPIGTVPILPPRFIPETGPNGPSIEDVRSRLKELQRTRAGRPRTATSSRSTPTPTHTRPGKARRSTG